MFTYLVSERGDQRVSVQSLVHLIVQLSMNTASKAFFWLQPRMVGYKNAVPGGVTLPRVEDTKQSTPFPDA